MSTPHDHASGLRRGIFRWDVLALVVNGVIGAGIFGLPSTVFALVGSYSLIAFIACALIIALIVLTFSEVASRFDRTGGPYLYTRAAFGSFVAFEVGWITWLGRITAFAALANLFLSYLANFWPAAETPLWRPILITAIALWFTVLNFRGVRNAAVLADVFTIGKLVPLLGLLAVGLFSLDGSAFQLPPAPSTHDFTKAVLLLIFAFSGFEATTIATGEIRDPAKNLPWALLTAVPIVACIYFLVQVVCIGTVTDLGQVARPIAEAGARVFGEPGRAFITLGALVSIFGTLGGIVLVSPRLLFAMAQEGDLPKLFSASHSRFHTPHVSLFISAAVMLGFTLASTFLSALTISTIIRVLSYIATACAMLQLRRKANVASAAFRVTAGGWVAGAALLLCFWLLGSVSAREWRDVSVVASIGIPLYFLGRWKSPLRETDSAR